MSESKRVKPKTDEPVKQNVVSKKAANGGGKSVVNKVGSTKKRTKAKASSSGSFFKNENVHRVLGVLLIAMSLYMAFCMVSYLFTGYLDNSSITSNGLMKLFSEKIAIANWGGRTGAWLAHYTYNSLFGVGSFGLVVMLFLIGMRAGFKVNIIPFWKSMRFAFYTMVWVSLVCGFAFGNNPDYAYLGGAFGYKVSGLISFYIGTVATWFLYFVMMVCFTSFNFNFPNHQIKSYFEHRKEEREATKEEREAAAIEKRERKEQERKDRLAEKVEMAKREREEKVAAEAAKRAEKESGKYNVEEFAVEDELDFVPKNKKDNKNDKPQIEEDMVDFEVTYKPIEELPTQKGEVEFFVEGEEMADKDENEELTDYDDLIIHNQNLIINNPISIQKETEFEIMNLPKVEVEVKTEVPIMSNDAETAGEALSEEEEEEKARMSIDEPYDPTLDLPHFVNPGIDLLEEYGSNGDKVNVQREELIENKKRIEDTLRNYGIEITRIGATIGPTVTLYEIVPAPGVRISKIKNLEDDIALSLAALGIRIIAPMPGKGTIGIEVPNQKPEIVSMRSILACDKFQNSTFELPVALGKTISNEPYIADLAKMPHLLMAGATGQGKSVGLNAIIASLIYKKHPAYLKFVMIDPKKVELNIYSKIERHYLAKLPDSEEAIITDVRKVVRTLHSLTIEMDNRYDLLKDAQVKNIKEYNAKFISRRLSPLHGHRFLPYIVVVIDEFADLIMTAGKEVEQPIARIAQLARAIGIHLIIATQRPSVNIITGAIKANFPARVAFRVVSKIDSRTILDSGGADQLIGRGDLLMSTGSDIIRLQCAFIDTPEIDRISEFVGAQRAYPDAFHLPECPDEEREAVEDFNPAERDTLFEDAARVIVQTQQGSTSLIQRKLKLGYNRAGRIIDQLEAAGIVGPFEGSKAREVRVANEIALEQLLKDLDS